MRVTLYDTRINHDFQTELIKERAINYRAGKVNNPGEVTEMMNQIFSLKDAGEEYCYLLALNTKNKVIGVFLVSKGTVNQSLVGAREIFVRALLCGAVNIVLVHNHPSKEATPSKEDLAVTKQVKEAGNLIGVKLTDHLIIGGNGYYSFLENALL